MGGGGGQIGVKTGPWQAAGSAGCAPAAAQQRQPTIPGVSGCPHAPCPTPRPHPPGPAERRSSPGQRPPAQGFLPLSIFLGSTGPLMRGAGLALPPGGTGAEGVLLAFRKLHTPVPLGVMGEEAEV